MLLMALTPFLGKNGGHPARVMVLYGQRCGRFLVHVLCMCVCVYVCVRVQCVRLGEQRALQGSENS